MVVGEMNARQLEEFSKACSLFDLPRCVILRRSVDNCHETENDALALPSSEMFIVAFSIKFKIGNTIKSSHRFAPGIRRHSDILKTREV
jgi:hypothetical protein